MPSSKWITALFIGLSFGSTTLLPVDSFQAPAQPILRWQLRISTGGVRAPRRYPRSQSHSLTATSHSVHNLSHEAGNNPNDNSNESPVSKILSAALLIAGTTVGGGFLALPTVVAPTGFFPSAIALVGVWAFLGGQALTLVEVLCRVRNRENDTQRRAPPPGIATAAKAAFGIAGERAITLLLVVVVEATLVSQISRAGMMFNPSLYRVGCSLAAMSVGAIVFGPRTSSRRISVTTSLNSALMATLCAMAALLFVRGVPAADWTRLLTVQNYRGLPEVIPTCLQLLVYGEILPTICNYLNFQERPIRWAIGLGSFLPLILEIGWAALGISLNPGTSGHLEDPVALLLQAGPIQLPLLCLAISAILTTILGSYLALQSTMDDAFRRSGKKPNRLSSASWIVLPALAIASISPSLFLQAIDFAGSYPVLLLWGIGPPLMALRLRDQMAPRSGLSKWWVPTSLLVSIVLFGMNVIPDIASSFRWAMHIGRGLSQL
jgi:tyrosine-specific transport protein